MEATGTPVPYNRSYSYRCKTVFFEMSAHAYQVQGDPTPLPVEDTMQEEIPWKIQWSIPYHTPHHTTPHLPPVRTHDPGTKYEAHPLRLSSRADK